MKDVNFRDIKDLDEWMKLWYANEVKVIATSLLHTLPEVPYAQNPVTDLRSELDAYYRKIDTCIRITEMDRYPLDGIDREVGNKAYQILVHNLLPELVKSEAFRYPISDPNGALEIPTWRTIIKFFANREQSGLDKEPYISDGRTFVVQLHISLQANLSISAPFGFVSETKKALSEESENVAGALVNVGALDYLIRNRIFAAIPWLKRKIMHWCWEYDPGQEKMEKMFPEGKKEWEGELEDLKSKAFKLALERVAPKEIVETLMALIVLRG